MLEGTWRDRFLIMRDSDKVKNGEWTYADIADIFDISRVNASTEIRAIMDEYPDAVTCDDSSRTKKFTFDFDALVSGEPSVEAQVEQDVTYADDKLAPLSISNIMGQLDTEGADVYLHTQRKFLAAFQRGGIIVALHEKGQKIPYKKYVVRMDNCVVLSIAELSSP